MMRWRVVKRDEWIKRSIIYSFKLLSKIFITQFHVSCKHPYPWAIPTLLSARTLSHSCPCSPAASHLPIRVVDCFWNHSNHLFIYPKKMNVLLYYTPLLSLVSLFTVISQIKSDNEKWSYSFTYPNHKYTYVIAHNRWTWKNTYCLLHFHHWADRHSAWKWMDDSVRGRRLEGACSCCCSWMKVQTRARERERLPAVLSSLCGKCRSSRWTASFPTDRAVWQSSWAARAACACPLREEAAASWAAMSIWRICAAAWRLPARGEREWLWPAVRVA